MKRQVAEAFLFSDEEIPYNASLVNGRMVDISGRPGKLCSRGSVFAPDLMEIEMSIQDGSYIGKVTPKKVADGRNSVKNLPEKEDPVRFTGRQIFVQ